MRFPVRKTLALAVCALILGACGHSTSSVEDVSFEPADITTTTTVVDPWAVPETIDAEYVRRVLQQIEDIRADVRRDVYSTHVFSSADQAKVEATYTGHYLAVALNQWPSLAAVDHPEVKPNPQAATAVVQDVLVASRQCVLVNATFNDSAALITARQPTQGQLVLVPAPHDRNINPTPWMVQQFTIPGQLAKVDACGYEPS